MTGSGVVVLGMHRSGTSAVTRMVSLLGIPTCVPADLNRDRTANPRGHWESGTLVRLNEQLLRTAGAAWWCPPPLDTDWTAIAGDRMDAAAADFHRVHPTPTWVWKDPRTCVTAPFWQRALPHRLVYLLAVRHPLAVAASLTTRDAFTPAAGVAVWEGYMTRAARSAAGAPTIVTSFEALVADPLGWAHELRDCLVAAGVEPDAGGSPALAARFVERSLAHHRAPRGSDGLSSEQAELLEELTRLAGPHERFAPRLPEPTASTEALFAEQRHQLLAPEARAAAAPVPPSGVPLLRPRPRAPAGPPSIGIVLAPRRTGAEVGATLRALLATAPASAELVAVGASDAPDDPRVTVIPAPVTGGRVAAIAAGLDRLGGEIAVICDAGIAPNPGWAEALTNPLERSDAGAVGPALLGRVGEAVHGGTVRGACLDVAWITSAPSADPFPVAIVPATMMAVRRDLLDAVGGFDAGMVGAGGEDTELCLRLWRAGCICLAVPRASAVVRRDGLYAEPPDATGFLHNRLRLGLLHLSPPRLRRFLEPLRRSPGFPEALARVLSDDIADRRALIDAVSSFDDAWLVRRFGVTALAELPAADGMALAPRIARKADVAREVIGTAAHTAPDGRTRDRRALPVRYSITVDGPPRFRRQAVGWLATATRLGEVEPEQVLVQCTETVPDDFRRAVTRSYGVEVVALPGPLTRRGTLNKLRQLDSPDLDADWIVLGDCDTVFAAPLPAAAFRPGLSAKLVDVGFPPVGFWADLLGRLGLGPGRLPVRHAAKGGGATYRNNCNGGLYIGDRDTWASIAPHWRWAADGLPTWITAPPSWEHHYDQIAFGIACARLGVDVHLLPRRMNFPFHEDPPDPLDLRPILLHHHQNLVAGRLLCQPGHDGCPGVLAAVNRVNGVLKHVRWERFGL